MDLDDFKRVNDVHGHPTGDSMLRDVVHALVGEFRSFDRVARYGGDEFVVILPNAALGAAAAAATRALERLGSVPMADLGNGTVGVSASVGVAQWQLADEHRRAARGLRRGPAALQAPGQGARHPSARARDLARPSPRPGPRGPWPGLPARPARAAVGRFTSRTGRPAARPIERPLCETAHCPCRPPFGGAHVREQLWRQGHAGGRRAQLRDLPPGCSPGAFRRREAAVLAEGPAREPAAHRGQRLRHGR